MLEMHLKISTQIVHTIIVHITQHLSLRVPHHISQDITLSLPSAVPPARSQLPLREAFLVRQIVSPDVNLYKAH